MKVMKIIEIDKPYKLVRQVNDYTRSNIVYLSSAEVVERAVKRIVKAHYKGTMPTQAIIVYRWEDDGEFWKLDRVLTASRGDY